MPGSHAWDRWQYLRRIPGCRQILKRALNARLPKDIRILDAVVLEHAFHPRFQALKKSYFYLIEKNQKQSVFFHRYAWRAR